MTWFVEFVSEYWMFGCMLFILLGGIGCGFALFMQAARLFRIQQEVNSRFHESSSGAGKSTEVYFKNSWYRLFALDLNSLVKLSPASTRVTLVAIFTIWLLLGILCGIWVENNYFESGRNLIPFRGLSHVVPIVIAIVITAAPFVFMRAIVQRRRAKLSHLFLPYVEQFERKYLQKYDLYPTVVELTDVLTTGPLKSMTFRVAQAMQRKQEEKLNFELDVFEHLVGSIFATTFFVMFREAYGLDKNATGRRETKRISVGLRSLIEQMHGYLRVTHQDKPKKKEIVQVGFFAFPILYGAHYFGVQMMGADGAKRFMFDSAVGSTLFVGGVFFGFFAIIVNLVISRRKFDL